MIDEFTDVNEGEKELMKMWNLHVMKNGYVGDCQVPLACEMFLDENGHEILKKNLYRNFILHICSLFDYSLVDSESVYKSIQKLQGILSKYTEGQKIMSEQRKLQVDHWQSIGIHKQLDQKFKSPQKQPTSTVIDGNNSKNKTNAMNPPAKRTASPMKKAFFTQNGFIGNKELISNKSNRINSTPSVPKTAPATKQAESNIDTRKSLSTSEISSKKVTSQVPQEKNTKTSSAQKATDEANKREAPVAAKIGIKRRLSLLRGILFIYTQFKLIFIKVPDIRASFDTDKISSMHSRGISSFIYCILKLLPSRFHARYFLIFIVFACQTLCGYKKADK